MSVCGGLAPGVKSQNAIYLPFFSITLRCENFTVHVIFSSTTTLLRCTQPGRTATSMVDLYAYARRHIHGYVRGVQKNGSASLRSDFLLNDAVKYVVALLSSTHKRPLPTNFGNIHLIILIN